MSTFFVAFNVFTCTLLLLFHRFQSAGRYGDMQFADRVALVRIIKQVFKYELSSAMID